MPDLDAEDVAAHVPAIVSAADEFGARGAGADRSRPPCSSTSAASRSSPSLSAEARPARARPAERQRRPAAVRAAPQPRAHRLARLSASPPDRAAPAPRSRRRRRAAHRAHHQDEARAGPVPRHARLRRPRGARRARARADDVAARAARPHDAVHERARRARSACAPTRDWKHLPCIILTAAGQEQQHRRAMELGASDFMTKPFSPKKLLRARRGAGRDRRPTDEPAARRAREPLGGDPRRRRGLALLAAQHSRRGRSSSSRSSTTQPLLRRHAALASRPLVPPERTLVLTNAALVEPIAQLAPDAPAREPHRRAAAGGDRGRAHVGGAR